MKGEMPYTTRGNVIGVVVGSKVEGFEENPRTFLKVITSEKIGWINSRFCRGGVIIRGYEDQNFTIEKDYPRRG